MTEPIISVIIPTHNSEATIKRCIQSITSQTYPTEKYKIIVVDDSSNENTVKIAKETKGVLVVETEPCTIGHARNIGYKNSGTKFLAYIDSSQPSLASQSESIYARNFVREFLKPIFRAWPNVHGSV